jgi:hypothetical protein
VGDVAEVLRTFDGPVDAVHDDAWFGAAPPTLTRWSACSDPVDS